MNARTLDPAHHLIEAEPYYEPVGEELKLFEAASRKQISVLLKAPTGSDKTRFMEHMAWRLKRPLTAVSCHDDPTSSDLIVTLSDGRPDDYFYVYRAVAW